MFSFSKKCAGKRKQRAGLSAITVILACLLAVTVLGAGMDKTTDTMANQTSEDLSMDTPRGVINSRWEEGIPSYRLVKKFKKESLAEFFGFLEDSSCSGTALLNALAMIYQLNDKNDAKANKKLLA